MKRIFLYCLFIAALVSLGCQSTLIRRDSDAIRTALLKEKPLGTSIDEVEAWVRAKNWSNIYVSHTRGYHRSDMPGKNINVGVKSIQAGLGQYYAPPKGFLTMVQVSWGFNEKGELIDVWVWKVADGP